MIDLQSRGKMKENGSPVWYFINHMLHNRNWPTWIGYGLAILVFVVAAIYAVMYATGYRLNLQTWMVEETGVLAVTTRPNGATVSLAGREYSRRTPFVLRNLLPGTYNLEVKLNGYHPYTQKVRIDSGSATEISNIDLVFENPEKTLLATEVQTVVSVGENVRYFGTDNKLYTAGDEAPEEVTFERIPQHVKTILASATKINSVVSRDNSGNLAINLNVGARRWLVVADVNGFRGAAFGSPINTAEANKTWWIDSDRLLFLIGGNLHTLDLTSSKLDIYSRNVMGAELVGGRVHFVAPNESGLPALWTDSNLFDDRPAEESELAWPTGREFTQVDVRDERAIVLVGTPGSQTLWIVASGEDDLPTKQTRVAAEIGSILYNEEKEQLLYTARNRLMNYDLELMVEKELKAFDTTTNRLLAQRGESVFALVKDDLVVLNPTAENQYEIERVPAQGQVYPHAGSDRVWVFAEGNLTQIELRKLPGLFGGLGNIIGQIKSSARS